MAVVWKLAGGILFLLGGVVGVLGTVRFVTEGNLVMVPVNLLLGAFLVLTGIWLRERA